MIYVLERDLYRIHSLTFNVDNQILIKTAGSFKLWNHKTREFTQNFSQDFNDLSSIFYRVVVLSPDGQAVAAFNQPNETIELWNVKTNQIIQILTEQPRTVSLAFSLDGHLLAIGNQYGSVRLWNFKNGTIIQTLYVEEGSISEYNSIESMVFHPNSLVLAISRKNSIIKFWNLETGELMENVIRHDPPKSIAFSPDGQSLAIGSTKLDNSTRTGTIQIWAGSADPATSF